MLAPCRDPCTSRSILRINIRRTRFSRTQDQPEVRREYDSGKRSEGGAEFCPVLPRTPPASPSLPFLFPSLPLLSGVLDWCQHRAWHRCSARCLGSSGGGDWRRFFDVEMLMFPEGSNVNVSLPFRLVSGDESRFGQFAQKVFDVYTVVGDCQLFSLRCVAVLEAFLRGQR